MDPANDTMAIVDGQSSRNGLRAADAGFDCHFVKPVSVRDLVLVLDQRVVSTVLPNLPSS